MPANNIHILSPEEMRFARTRFSFELKDDSILVKVNGYNRVTAHKMNGFTQTFMFEDKKRKISITKQAINFWIDHFRPYNLIDVQNCINMLAVTYQDVNVENIKSIISNPDKIKIRKA